LHFLALFILCNDFFIKAPIFPNKCLSIITRARHVLNHVYYTSYYEHALCIVCKISYPSVLCKHGDSPLTICPMKI